MGKIAKGGGASVRQFTPPRTPAEVLRSRGKLGPYTEAKVETFTAAPEVTVTDPDADMPKPADVRAWAKSAGLDVPARGKLSADVLEAYKQAQTTDNDDDNNEV